ncbi:hypothetical protein OXPF_14600 [Oxobacter pfennigii]|uniref:Uncharacterized protein n=1 Tax=Oxobacter pfennigii TaxID=36849 RepID=A0A0P8WB88_9CLOT|nr:hypothetical protein [Oxobacter pfennigii]KPU44982.1 hypothetical protein OXPF_14600 [Oxobacter pfennigii]
MKKRTNYFKIKKVQKNLELGSNDYEEMFEEGFSDAEISNEFGVDEDYIKKLREDYQKDY